MVEKYKYHMCPHKLLIIQINKVTRHKENEFSNVHEQTHHSCFYLQWLSFFTMFSFPLHLLTCSVHRRKWLSAATYLHWLETVKLYFVFTTAHSSELITLSSSLWAPLGLLAMCRILHSWNTMLLFLWLMKQDEADTKQLHKEGKIISLFGCGC